MKTFQNDRGYALFTTVIVIVLFGLLSMALLSLTIAGAKKSAIREEATQAHELADKGIDHITQQINAELENALGTNGLSRSAFEAKLLEILGKYLCENMKVSPINTEQGDYEVCIESFTSIDGEENSLRKLVNFYSTGISGDQNKSVNTYVEIGSKSVPEVLKYTVGSNIRSNNPRNGEGNLLLHGGVDIHGDVRVDGHLVTYERGVGSYRWINSIQPRMYEIISGVRPRIVVGKNMYRMNQNPYSGATESNHTKYLNNDNFSINRYSMTTNTQDLFDDGYAPVAVKRNPQKEKIQIKEHKSNFYYNQNSGATRVNVGTNRTFSGYTTNAQRVVPYYESCAWFGGCTNVYNGEIIFQNTNKFKSLALGGGGHFKRGNHSFQDGLYVGGKLKIGNLSQTDHSSNRDNITIDGTMYVDGDLQIQGANLTSNAMMYVDGDVEIRFSSIQGKDLGNGDTGTLIIFATGNIFLANNSVHQDNPTHIKGYFYSEKNMEIYGVGSNIHIDGGIAGNRVVLNAVRGRVTNGSRSNSTYVQGVGYVDNVTNQRVRNSRLTIKYDTELIENFLKLNPPEPVIYNVDPPELISRE